MEIKRLNLYCWEDPIGGNGWALGWMTGPDNDLVCVRPGITNPNIAEAALSPVSTCRTSAIFGFCLKYMLFSVDSNLYTIK